MKVQTKILLLILFVFIFFIISLGGFMLFRHKQNDLITKEKKQTQRVLVESVLSYIRKNLAETVNDFAVGNDFTQLINKPEKKLKWENLMYFLRFNHVDAIWIYNDKNELIYHINKIVGYRTNTIEIPISTLNKIRRSNIHSFFLPLHNDFIQVCGSTIHSSEDINRIQEPKGFILMAKVWDYVFIDKMSKLTGTSIILKKNPTPLLNSNSIDYINTFPILSYNGSKITEIVFIRENPFLREYNKLSRTLLLIFICFAGVIICVLIFAFRRLINKPLGIIFSSLTTENINLLKLKNPNDEFGKIADLIKKFYEQKQLLAQQIEENIRKTKALEISERNFRSFVEQSSEGIIIFDQNGIVIETNNAVSKLLQIPREEITNQKVWDIQYKFFPTERKNETVFNHLYKSLLTALKDANTAFFNKQKETQLYLSDNSTLYVKSNAFPIYVENKFLIGLIITDITKLKEAEKKVFDSLKKEKELNLLKNHFISTVSHEFRTPMTIIYSNLQLIEDLKDSPVNAEKCYARVYTAIKQMTYILDEVNLINKDFAGKLDFNKQQVICKNFFYQVMEDAACLNKKISIKIEYNLHTEKIYIDPVLVQYIIINLLSNAIKFSREGGIVNFILNESGNFLNMQFKDHGIGIPADDIPKIFEPFHRANNAENIKGTGLGMSIVKRSLDLHKGKIEVSSEVGKGTIISVTLPFETE